MSGVVCCHLSRFCVRCFSLDPGLEVCADQGENVEVIVNFGLLNALLVATA